MKISLTKEKKKMKSFKNDFKKLEKMKKSPKGKKYNLFSCKSNPNITYTNLKNKKKSINILIKKQKKYKSYKKNETKKKKSLKKGKSFRYNKNYVKNSNLFKQHKSKGKINSFIPFEIKNDKILSKNCYKSNVINYSNWLEENKEKDNSNDCKKIKKNLFIRSKSRNSPFRIKKKKN